MSRKDEMKTKIYDCVVSGKCETIAGAIANIVTLKPTIETVSAIRSLRMKDLEEIASDITANKKIAMAEGLRAQLNQHDSDYQNGLMIKSDYIERIESDVEEFQSQIDGGVSEI